jgi:hypothetical protein
MRKVHRLRRNREGWSVEEGAELLPEMTFFGLSSAMPHYMWQWRTRDCKGRTIRAHLQNIVFTNALRNSFIIAIFCNHAYIVKKRHKGGSISN